MKAEKEHIIPMSDPALAALKLARAAAGESAFVFPGTNTVSVKGVTSNSNSSAPAQLHMDVRLHGCTGAVCSLQGKASATKSACSGICRVPHTWAWRALRRHLCTELALRPWARAIAATEAPGWLHSIKTCALNASL